MSIMYACIRQRLFFIPVQVLLLVPVRFLSVSNQIPFFFQTVQRDGLLFVLAFQGSLADPHLALQTRRTLVLPSRSGFTHLVSGEFTLLLFPYEQASRVFLLLHFV